MATGEDDFLKLGELSFETWGRVVGVEMLLRAVLAKWALETAEPAEFLEDLRKSTINGMTKQGRDDDPVEAVLIHHAESQINATIENVKARIAGTTL